MSTEFNNGLIVGLALNGVIGGKTDKPEKMVIDNQLDLEYTSISSVVGTRSSIAIRRPQYTQMTDRIFTAQVEDGKAIIRSTFPRFDLKSLRWSDVKVIDNVSEISIMFDGFMEEINNLIEIYTTGLLPYAFYVDNSNSLKFINLDDESVNGTISDDAFNVATVRGLYAESIGMDDGIWCFYTNSLGELWEARVFEGEVIELTQITLKPDGVTQWIDVWAGFTFDYRIILQLKGDDGNVYTLISKSRPSGYSLNEYLRLSNIKVEGKIGLIPPELLTIENVGV